MHSRFVGDQVPGANATGSVASALSWTFVFKISITNTKSIIFNAKFINLNANRYHSIDYEHNILGIIAVVEDLLAGWKVPLPPEDSQLRELIF